MSTCVPQAKCSGNEERWLLSLAGKVHVGQMGQSRGLELSPRSFSWDAEGEKRLPEVLFQVFIKGVSGFHLQGGTVC